MLRRFHAAIARPVYPVRKGVRWAWSLQSRERARLANEIAETRVLVRLLARQRRGRHITKAERDDILHRLRRLVALSPYLVLFVSPGGFLALPILAWWLDRRHQRRKNFSLDELKD